MRDYTPIADGFYWRLQELAREQGCARSNALDDTHVRAALAKENRTPADLSALLSPAALPYLEPMAQLAQEATQRHFGRCIQMFTPLYLANYCANRCVYCGFNSKRHIDRQRLTLEEVEREALVIKASGLRSILALTGDDPATTGVEYLIGCIAVLAKHFSSVVVEVPAMSTEDYCRVVVAGVSGVTLFQETYKEERYATLHPSGPKRHFAFRLDALHRAALGGVRAINLGVLLGLDDWRQDLFCMAMHADFLRRRYPHLEISFSLPRLRPCGAPPASPEEQNFRPVSVSDLEFVQGMLALRLFLPYAGITLSTREPAWLRDHLLPLGVTRMSAGVSTSVGGHAVVKDAHDAAPQFAISDSRSVDAMAAAITRLGYQPVFADWLLTGNGNEGVPQGVATALGGNAGQQAQLP